MWDSKLLCYILFIGLLCSCNPVKRIVDFNEDRINATFFDNIVKDADSIMIFKTHFREQYVENKNGVLEFSVLNDAEQHRAFKYLNVEGDNQDIYLIRFVNQSVERFIYFSVKYGTFPDKEKGYITHCKGFGPAYYGVSDTNLDVINFYKALKVAKDGTVSFKSGKNPKPVFMLSKPFDGNKKATIKITRIMFGEYNKFAGRRPVVMTVSDVFKDMRYLPFDYVKTLKHP